MYSGIYIFQFNIVFRDIDIFFQCFKKYSNMSMRICKELPKYGCVNYLFFQMVAVRNRLNEKEIMETAENREGDIDIIT